MRLLLTRAEPEAQSSTERLRKNGHTVLVAPMLEIAFLPPPPAIADPAVIAVTSANAVRAILQWKQARGWRDKPVFAVGDATADAARAAGFRKVASAKGGSAELAALIARTARPETGPVLFPAAELVAGDLAAALRDAGFTVEPVIAYRATPAGSLPPDAREAIANQKLDAALFYSERGAAAFGDIVNREGLRLGATKLLALSVQVAGPLRELPSGGISVAAQPTEASLFALLAAAD